MCPKFSDDWVEEENCHRKCPTRDKKSKYFLPAETQTCGMPSVDSGKWWEVVDLYRTLAVSYLVPMPIRPTYILWKSSMQHRSNRMELEANVTAGALRGHRNLTLP